MLKRVSLLLALSVLVNGCCDTIPGLPWCSEDEPELAVSPASLDFGSNTNSMNFTITNAGTGTLTWNLSKDQNWISYDVDNGSTTGETDQVTVSVDRTIAEYGNQSGKVMVSSNGGSFDLTVVLTRDPGGTPFIQALEGDNCTQNNAGGAAYQAGTNYNFQNSSAFENDEARSFKFSWLPVNAKLTFYDDPDGSTNDDWTEVTIKKIVAEYCLESLEESRSDDVVTVTYHRNNGLAGKVSRMEMR